MHACFLTDYMEYSNLCDKCDFYIFYILPNLAGWAVTCASFAVGSSCLSNDVEHILD